MGSADWVIREAKLEDASGIRAHLAEIAAEPDNGILQTLAELRSVEEEERRIDEVRRTGNSLMMIAVNPTGQVIGLASYRGGQREANAHSAGIGITVQREWRNQGIGTALMQFLINHARRSGIIRRLELEVFTHNARAIHVYHDLGFQFEGTKRKAYFRDGRYVDAHLMSLLFFEE